MDRLGKRLAQLLSRPKKRALRVPIAERFRYFRGIGEANDTFLNRLAGLQEAMDRATLAGLGTPASAIEGLSCQVGVMVRSLVAMTGGRYEELQQHHTAIEREIRQQARKLYPLEDGPLVVWPTEPDALRPEVVGPKAARLAEVALRTGLSVPPFFSISVYGYRLFVEASGIRDTLNEMLRSVDLHDFHSTKRFSDAVADVFTRTPVPPDLERELSAAYHRLVSSRPGVSGVAVRSSAVVEDADVSFAGQFESVLNVREENLAAAYRRVIASKYRHEALQYAIALGFLDDDIPMPVMVMSMVQPWASGVVYSRSPERPEDAIVTAVRGLAQVIVDGAIVPDTYLVSSGESPQVRGVSRGDRTFSLRCAAGGGLEEFREGIPSAEAPVLGETAICSVASAARSLEDHFGSPQDVEWALSDEGDLMIVQTRPLRVSSSPVVPSHAMPQVEGYRILLRGITRASGGAASGPAYLLRDLQAIETVTQGAILCVPTTSPRLAGVMGSVRGIIAAAGSPTGHMATVAREFGVPCLVGAGHALSVISGGQVVTMDADAGVVYEGEVRELLHGKPHHGPPSTRPSSPRQCWERLLQHVAPLTLSEPDSPLFCASNCRTLHDIARYVHQKSMAEMFDLEDLSAQEKRAARALQWRVPMEVMLLDLGDGIAADAGRCVPIDKVISRPLQALIEGMTDPRLRWSGPVGFDLKGFMSVVVRSAADDQRYGEPSYCLCSKDYVHFASRLAYHFATVDAICTPSLNENYARFLFFGGAAVAARREWRAHFLATVLRCNGFVEKQAGDRVEAILAKRDAEQIEEALLVLGRLMVASRHLDMVIESQAVANALAQAFLAGDFGFESVGKAGR